jgi:hypothetical protein
VSGTGEVDLKQSRRESSIFANLTPVLGLLEDACRLVFVRTASQMSLKFGVRSKSHDTEITSMALLLQILVNVLLGVGSDGRSVMDGLQPLSLRLLAVDLISSAVIFGVGNQAFIDGEVVAAAIVGEAFAGPARESGHVIVLSTSDHGPEDESKDRFEYQEECPECAFL